MADKISRLIIWYSLQKKDLTTEDLNYLDTSLVECYRRYGITFDNASILDQEGCFRQMPILADWYSVLMEDPNTKHLAMVLARYVTGSASAMGDRNDLNLDTSTSLLTFPVHRTICFCPPSSGLRMLPMTSSPTQAVRIRP